MMSCARCDSLSRDIAILRQEVALLSCLVKEKLASPVVVPKERVDSPRKNEAEWRVVKSPLTPKPVIQPTPLETSNRFECLREEELDTSADILIVGDSLVRGQGTIFSRRTGRRCRTVCLPGAGVTQATEVLTEWREMTNPVIVHVGSNDVGSLPSEALKRKYRELLLKLRERRSPSVLVGILPRMATGSEWSSRALSMNAWLSSQCSAMGITFFDPWEYFVWRRFLYRSDGVHLTDSGKRFIADALGDLFGERALYSPFLDLR